MKIKKTQTYTRKKRHQGSEKTLPNLSHSGSCRAQSMLEHPSQLHIMARGHRKRRSKIIAEEFNDSKEPLPHHPSGFLRHGQARRRGSWNNIIIDRDRQLNSQTFQQCLENLWQSFPEEKMKSFTSFDSLWYVLYTDKSYREKVLSWVKKKDIFSRKYVIVPIVKLFVLDMYRAEERPVNEKQLLKMPFLVPKVPQQRNGEECGYYVLYYISLFVKSAPDNFSVSEGYPYFMTKDWFTVEALDSFCRTLDSSCN